jgi:hypothetical protein
MVPSDRIVYLCVVALMVIVMFALLLRLRTGRGRSNEGSRPAPAAPASGATSPLVAAYRWIATGRRRLLLGGLFFGLLLIAVGITIVIPGADDIRDGWASRSWPTVRGLVTGSTVSADDSDDITLYRASVTYEYTVDGRQYVGSQIRFFDEGYSDPQPARDKAVQYPVGASVDVYYSPEDPSSAVLEPGASQIGLWASPGLGGCCALAGLLIAAGSLVSALRALRA